MDHGSCRAPSLAAGLSVPQLSVTPRGACLATAAPPAKRALAVSRAGFARDAVRVRTPVATPCGRVAKDGPTARHASEAKGTSLKPPSDA